MEQLLLHLIGDYILQNDWLANNKTKNTLAAFLHALIYSLPFLLITPFINGIINWAWITILVTHFFIDRFRLAVLLIKLTNWNWKSNNFGYSNDKPLWMSVWLMIIVDNTMHLLINYLSIKYLN